MLRSIIPLPRTLLHLKLRPNSRNWWQKPRSKFANRKSAAIPFLPTIVGYLFPPTMEDVYYLENQGMLHPFCEG